MLWNRSGSRIGQNLKKILKINNSKSIGPILILKRALNAPRWNASKSYPPDIVSRPSDSQYREEDGGVNFFVMFARETLFCTLSGEYFKLSYGVGYLIECAYDS